MEIERKVGVVEELFKNLEVEVAELQESTGLHCIENCVKCCITPNIVAMPIEFYPLALHLYKTGQAEKFLTRIEKTNNTKSCPLLGPLLDDETKTGCQYYKHRGLICRLFAFNHRIDRLERRRLSACKPMQLEQPDSVALANTILATKPIGPKASNYYSQLEINDLNGVTNYLPIGESIRIAVETVLTYYHYKGDNGIEGQSSRVTDAGLNSAS